MNRNEAKAKADRVISVASLDEVASHLKNMAAILAKHNLANHGFYAFSLKASDGSSQLVFMELAA
jgi:hypothetical protein